MFFSWNFKVWVNGTQNGTDKLSLSFDYFTLISLEKVEIHFSHPGVNSKTSGALLIMLSHCYRYTTKQTRDDFFYHKIQYSLLYVNWKGDGHCQIMPIVPSEDTQSIYSAWHTNTSISHWKWMNEIHLGVIKRKVLKIKAYICHLKKIKK